MWSHEWNIHFLPHEMKKISYSFIKIYPIYYQAVHCLNLFWELLTMSHYYLKSAIGYVYIEIKRGIQPCSHGLRGGFAPWIWFKPSSKIFLLAVPRRYFFCRSFVLFLSYVCYAFACLFIDALWSPAGKGLTSWLITFPCGILGQVWY